MKRRGFLGMLLGAPAVPVAAAAMEKLPNGFTRGLVESEPEAAAYEALYKIQEYENFVTCVYAPLIYSEFFRRNK